MLSREALLNSEFQAKDLWIRAFSLSADWQDIARNNDLSLHASLVPDLDVTEILEN